MQAFFQTPKLCLANISVAALQTEVNRTECLRLTRYISKVALLLTELELCTESDSNLGGDQRLMGIIESITVPIKQAETLLARCASAEPASSWPLEDWAGFQAVVLGLCNSVKSLLAWALGTAGVPEDLIDDIAHTSDQMCQLHFSEEQFKASASHDLAEAPRKANTSFENRQQQGQSSSSNVAAAVKTLENGGLSRNPICPQSCDRGDLDTSCAQRPGIVQPVTADSGSLGRGETASVSVAPEDLPQDPFNMTPRVQSSTIHELQNLKTDVQDGSLVEGES